MTAKKTLKKKELDVDFRTGYEKTARMVSNDVYNKNFTTFLTSELQKIYKPKKALSILSSLSKRVKIVNKETFFLESKIGMGDIGRAAWRDSEDDIMDFTSRVITLMGICRSRGMSEIDLSSVLFYLSWFKGYSKLRTSENCQWKAKLAAQSIAAACICGKFNCYTIQVVHPTLVNDIEEELGIPNAMNYRAVVTAFLDTFDKFYNKEMCNKRTATLSYPQIKFIIPVYQDIRESQILYLAHVLIQKVVEVRRAVKNITALEEDTPEMRAILEKLKQLKNLQGVEDAAIFKQLRRIKESNRLLSYPMLKDFHRYFCASHDSGKTALAKYKKYRTEDVFTERESYLVEPFNDFGKVVVDCKGINLIQELEPLLYSCAELLMLKLKRKTVLSEQILSSIEQPKLLITLENVGVYTQDWVNSVKEIENKLRSLHNSNIVININFDSSVANSRLGENVSTHLRIISDIHTDINRDRNYVYDFGSDFVINCGDTGSNAQEEREWIRSYMRRGVVVPGNHLGYTSYIPERDGEENIKDWGSYVNEINTVNGQAEELQYAFRPTATPYLSNNIIEESGMIIMGNMLYTDFKLFGEDNQAACMIEAARGLNDFQRCYFFGKVNGKKQVKRFSVEDHLNLHKICLGYIKNRVRYLRNHNNTKPIIVVTHHTPLPFCVSDKYKNDPLSAAFASDLRYFLDEYPEIRLWCSGHVHDPYDFIYNETRFVCEPWGYFNENGFDENNYGNRISIANVKSNQSWRRLLKEEISAGIVKDYGYCDRLAKLDMNLFTGKKAWKSDYFDEEM